MYIWDHDDSQGLSTNQGSETWLVLSVPSDPLVLQLCASWLSSSSQMSLTQRASICPPKSYAQVINSTKSSLMHQV